MGFDAMISIAQLANSGRILQNYNAETDRYAGFSRPRLRFTRRTPTASHYLLVSSPTGFAVGLRASWVTKCYIFTVVDSTYRETLRSQRAHINNN